MSAVALLGQPQWARADDAIAAGAATPAVSRAEVIADLRLWQRAGVDRHEELARYYQVDIQAYEHALTEYRRLRQGPAYQAELARALAEAQGPAGRTASR